MTAWSSMSATPGRPTTPLWCCCTASRSETTAGTPSSTGSPPQATGAWHPTSAAIQPVPGRPGAATIACPNWSPTSALIDASGAQRVHLVGHDWGAAVAWGVAAELPERLATVSPVSVPHPAAFLKSFVTSRQGLASWYMGFFQLPWLPEWLLTRGKGAVAARALRRSGQSSAAAERDAQGMIEPGALSGGLNWYRGLPLSNLRDSNQRISVPTLYVWSDDDIALKPKAARNTARYVTADYRFEVMSGVSHWIPDTEPDRLADLLLDWFAAHPID